MHTAIKVRHAAEFRRCVLELDISGIRKLWAHVSPHLAQPSNDREAIYSLHMARANMETAPAVLRQYSDRWMRERGLGTYMHESLRPKNWKARG